MGNMAGRSYGLLFLAKIIAMASFDNTKKMSILRCTLVFQIRPNIEPVTAQNGPKRDFVVQ